MSFYVTLPSYDRPEFSDNQSNVYKVRLPHKLPIEDGWKVGLASASFPNISIFPQLRSIKELFVVHYNQSIGNTVIPKKTWIGGDDLDQWERLNCIHDGVAFMNVIHTLKERIHSQLTIGTSIQADEWLEFKWSNSNGYPEVQMGNNGMSSTSMKIHIKEELANAMGWLYVLPTTGKQSGSLGSNLLEVAPDNDRPINTGLTGAKPWVLEGGWLKLSYAYNWRFVNLNAAFRKGNVTIPTTVHVYSNVGKSSIVGDQVTDLLREVYFNPPNFSSTVVYYEPINVRYVDIRNRDVEIIEIQISEINGSIIHFRDGDTVITLHFKKQ